MKLYFDAIVITSDEPYSKMWHTQLIYTEFLSKANAVFYIDPPKKWTIKNVFRSSLNNKIENKNLTILHYINKLPSFLKFGNAYNERYNEYKIGEVLKSRGYKKILIWHFDSYRNSFSNSFFNNSLSMKRIYHVIDPFYKNPIDRSLCKISDLIIVTSPRNNQFYIDYSDKVINISQGLDLEIQNRLVNDKATIFPKTDSDYIVLLGTISDDIDFDWLLHLLNNSMVKLVVIGKRIHLNVNTQKSDLLFNHPQVEYLGLLSPKEFYPVLKRAKAGVIVYNEERRSKVCSPLKALNYLVSGLPVITNIDCEIPELLKHCIYYNETLEQFRDTINKALTGELNFNSKASQSYEEKISLENMVKKIVEKL
ncbi:MAG: hypothetical protein V4677_03865 [Bacteroidota bacterium]